MKQKKIIKTDFFLFLYIVLLFFLISFTFPTFANSNYVLPYPSAMPGSILYKVNLVKEKLMSYWYFGDFGQFEYNLKYSDKYLVEAKTLSEYKQYLLATNALKKSNSYFARLKNNLNKAKKNGKNTTEIENKLKNASLKHIEILNSIKYTSPSQYIWKPENDLPTKLNIEVLIQEAINIRQ